jgi:hypothetical protein
LIIALNRNYICENADDSKSLLAIKSSFCIFHFHNSLNFSISKEVADMKRRLIICCDGTWQDPAQVYPTNVMKMVQSIKPKDNNGIEQVVYYDE